MKHRKLRIAWSVVWGVLCLLLIVLWGRSHRTADHVSVGIVTHVLSLDSNGRLLVISLRPASLRGWPGDPISFFIQHDYPAFRIRQGPGGGLIFQTRNWISVVATGLVTVVPWIPWPKRFSLRTLLIAVTVVAAVLGLAIWAAR
jgi:hypothetical protein